MTELQTPDPAPDWNSLSTELHCPLCEYNLRGLDQPRCPECGFTFTWAELKLGQEQTHPYLFEHHPKRNIWSFWKTYWRDCRPRTFWAELSPAQPVRMSRLMIYWFISSLVVIVSVIMPLSYGVWDRFQSPPPVGSPIFSSSFSPSGTRTFVPIYPPAPPVIPFWDRLNDAWTETLDDCLDHGLFAGALTLLLWPWLTMLFLLIFVESMRKAKINKRHLLRVIVYGTDFGFVMILPLLLSNGLRFRNGSPMLIALLCGAFALYRLTIAYKRYLRFHMPFATVLSSQIIVTMIFLIVYLRLSLR